MFDYGLYLLCAAVGGLMFLLFLVLMQKGKKLWVSHESFLSHGGCFHAPKSLQKDSTFPQTKASPRRAKKRNILHILGMGDAEKENV